MWTAIRITLFLAGLGVLILLVVQLDVAAVVRLMARTGWSLALIFLIYAGSQTTRAAALWLCQSQVDRLPYRDVLGIRVSAEAVRLLTFIGPLLAEPSKVWLLRRRGLDTTAGIAAIVAEIVAHSLVAAVLSCVALAYLIAGFDVSPVVRTVVLALIWAMVIYVVVGVTAIWLRIYLIGSGAALLRRVGLIRFVHDPRDVRRMEDLLLSVFHDRPARLGVVLLFQAAATLFLVLEVSVAVTAMGLDVPSHYPLLIEGGLKFVSVVFFFIPAQVGASEGAYVLLFEILGLSTAAGLSLAFIRRLRSLAVAAIGFVIITVLSK